MTILHDGRVVPCTVEWSGETVIGDLNNESLVDVWRGEAMTEIRNKILDKRMQCLSLCINCDIPYSENRLNFLNQLLLLRNYPDFNLLRQV